MEESSSEFAPSSKSKHRALPGDRFDVDDAFSDGEDNDGSFTFSKSTIHDEFAKYSENWNDAAEEELEQTESVPSADASVSTFDIYASSKHTSSPPQSSTPSTQPATPDGSGSADVNSANFSNISLSERVPHSAEDVEEDGQNSTDHHDSYPSVHIDVSKSPATRVEIVDDSDELPRDSPVSKEPVSISSPSLTPSPTQENDAASLSTSAPASTPTFPSIPPIPSTSSSPRAANAPKAPAPKHRPTRSVGPSTFEKVMSKTRPSYLPPKTRQEDDKHMSDWSTMMKQSRAAEEKRRKALQERRLARERKIEESLHLWEKEIVPDWKAVYKKPSLRKLWWGGIPTKLRTVMWERAAGNALALSKDHYRSCLSRAKRALTNGTFPSATLAALEEDIGSTLPALHIFHPETGPLYQDLKDMLCAWVVSRSDEGLGYTFGAAKIAAMFLINMPPPQGFVVMRNLLERHCMRSFYGGAATKDDVEAYYRIFDTLLADGMPKIYFNFKQHQISPAAYLPEWLLPVFLDHLPFEACARVWDVLLLEGDSFLYRAALAVLGVLEPKLFFPDRKELMDLLRGENKPALEVAKRDGRPLNGGKYEIYGLDEETLWERIDSMEEWWKDSTWTRLIQRELPDI